ncbi:hypothetical protein ACFLX9_00420 [Chloroflexota bacterium]
MRPIRHLLVSSVAGSGAWVITGEPWGLPVTVAAGVLVDLDHGPDVWWSLVLENRPISTLVFHAWEWLAGLLVVGIWTGFPWWLTAMLVGYGLHIATDHVANKASPWRYFIVYRAWCGFQTERVGDELGYDAVNEVLKQEIPPAAWLMDWGRQRRNASSRTHKKDEPKRS